MYLKKIISNHNMSKERLMDIIALENEKELEKINHPLVKEELEIRKLGFSEKVIINKPTFFEALRFNFILFDLDFDKNIGRLTFLREVQKIIEKKISPENSDDWEMALDKVKELIKTKTESVNQIIYITTHDILGDVGTVIASYL